MPFTVRNDEKDELLVTYASMILFDDNIAITAENIDKLISAAGASVEPYWPKLFAQLLEGRDVGALLMTSGGAAAPAAGGAAPATGGAAAGGDSKGKEAEKEKEKEKEESGGVSISFFSPCNCTCDC